jgi:hypothetical protein
VFSGFNDFFLAAAGVAGALIGLLFVAVSIAHDRLTAEDEAQVSRVRASAALTAFLNALAVSLFALVPGIGVGWTALVVSLSGLVFLAGAILSLVRVRRSQPGSVRDGLFLVGLAVTFAIQLISALRAIDHPHESGPVRTIAILVIVCFLIGIARSWELIGGPNIGLSSELGRIARRGDARESSGPPTKGG